MQRLPRVLTAAAAIPGLLLATTPAGAGDGVVLVGCDLFSRDGPRVAFVQSQGVGQNGSNRRSFIDSSPGSRADDLVNDRRVRAAALEGRECAEVLSGLIDDGLEFKAMQVFGEDGDIALWFFQED